LLLSDGVIAILITIMVLELRIPHGADMAALMGVAPSFLTYVMSFVYLAIYWNNHHHLIHTVGRVDGLILWANSHLLFWLSLIPAATAWRQPPGSAAHRTLWRCAADACNRLPGPAEGSHTQTRCPVRAGSGAPQRH
jgi:uncharacterized membrane protein